MLGVFFSFFLIAACDAAIHPEPVPLPVSVTKLQTINVPHPAFLSTSPTGDTLTVSRFSPNPLFRGAVAAATIATTANGTASVSTPADFVPSVTWPNEVSFVPMGAVSRYGGHTTANVGLVAIPGGFLVPGKSTGAITVSKIQGGGSEIQITEPVSGHFYHHVEWIDCNGDGWLDAVTTRVNKPIIGTPNPEWLWLENPGGFSANSVPWREHSIAGGLSGNPFGPAPDFFFDIQRNSSDETPTGLATFASFFGGGVSVAFGPPFAGRSSSNIDGFVLDGGIGAGYASSFVDVDGDGVDEIVATNHVNNNYGGTSGVFVFYLDPPTADPRVKGSWKRTVLAEGFETRLKGKNQAALDQAVPFRPRIGGNTEAWFLLPGDGAGEAYVLFPTGAGRFNYSVSILGQWHGNTIGQGAVAQLIDNGPFNLFVPVFEGGEIHTFSIF